MVASHNFTRVDTLELKDLIYRKIGRQRAENYFDHLKRFVCLKLSKLEFDKICIQTIGRENISLHNKLIQSIVQNACHAKIPPRKVENRLIKVAHGYQKTFPHCPRKCRSAVNRDRKFRDRPSPLGPLGKSPSVLTCEETVSRAQEQQQSISEFHSLEDGEEVEQSTEKPRRWNYISAPLGFSVNPGRSCFNKTRYSGETCENSGELPDTRLLRGRLERKLASEGVEISLDGADLLNNGLDVFLKRLIGRCVGISGSGGGIISGKYGTREMKSNCECMLDFRVAMESNPTILGQDWSIQLEKICNYAS